MMEFFSYLSIVVSALTILVVLVMGLKELLAPVLAAKKEQNNSISS